MKLIVGLGNPGLLYRNTRHNIGSAVVKAFAQTHRVTLRKERGVPAVSGKLNFSGNVMVAVPLTFMNLSGGPVRQLCEKYAVSLNDLLVVYDDFSLEFGVLRVRPSGSAGGHNGVRSVIDCLQSQDFHRLRVGIGRPDHPVSDMARYVLAAFNRQERVELKGIIDKACACCEMWASEGVEKCMNVFNGRNSSSGSPE
ncbi:MAG: aminoacyl-tRNA hydrolase [Candidatus Omnitrophica bacterium]|nr:aminoacyl-tRNA hydrolase [Candidatus Omnitrophota bacterium]